MGFSLTYAAPTCCNLQSHTLFAAFRSKPYLSLQLQLQLLHYRNRPKRIRKVRAQSENGALLTAEKPSATNYGRQYFPLAAVVGQVIYYSLSLSLLVASVP